MRNFIAYFGDGAGMSCAFSDDGITWDNEKKLTVAASNGYHVVCVPESSNRLRILYWGLLSIRQLWRFLVTLNHDGCSLRGLFELQRGYVVSQTPLEKCPSLISLTGTGKQKTRPEAGFSGARCDRLNCLFRLCNNPDRDDFLFLFTVVTDCIRRFTRLDPFDNNH